MSKSKVDAAKGAVSLALPKIPPPKDEEYLVVKLAKFNQFTVPKGNQVANQKHRK